MASQLSQAIHCHCHTGAKDIFSRLILRFSTLREPKSMALLPLTPTHPHTITLTPSHPHSGSSHPGEYPQNAHVLVHLRVYIKFLCSHWTMDRIPIHWGRTEDATRALVCMAVQFTYKPAVYTCCNLDSNPGSTHILRRLTYH